MPKKRQRRNPLPAAPPKRRFAGQPTSKQVSSSLARVRKLARDLPENERSFDPSRAPSWRGSSRDLVVNPKDSSSYGAGARLRPGYAYEGPDVPNAELPSVPNDDWDTVMISDGDTHDVRFVRYLTIDGAHCSVFERKNPPYGYLAQMSHMARNGDVDPRDIPAHLRKAEINEIPDQNGDDIGYSQGYSSKGAPGWYQVEYATGSDYSGGSVHESNYQVLAELLLEHHPRDAEPVVWARTSGGHGTYGIVVRYGDLEDDVRDAIDALEDYPLMDEEHHSNLEMEQQDAAWENWGRSDFIKAVAKLEGKDRDALDAALTPDEWYSVFHAMMESANENWEDQQGAGQYIDTGKLAEELTTFLESGKFPQYSQDTEDDALQALYDALPNLEED